ncbi:MAG: serpin family protein [Prevotella sp.]|nr:serpin family protein [Prevotella sp.]
MKKYILLLTLSVCVAAAQAAAPKRPMLEQGKTWVYVYHQVTDETIGDVPLWWIYYRLNGDTIIDGRQYMKMYRSDWDNNLNEYYGAYREDEEGRVYLYSRYNKEEYKVFDLEWADFEYHPDNIIIETIKSNGKLFNRYRYQSRRPEGDTYDVYCSIEGVGYKDRGIIHLPWDTPDCPEDYEELYEVFSKDFFFSASDFNAPKEIELAEGEQELINSNNDFAFNLFRKARGEKSKILSPLSITFALGMLNNGADGETLKEINQTLGFGDAGADAINVFCQKMLKESNTLDEKTKALIANTIFVNEGCGYRLQEGFIDKANTFYDAQPQNRNFADGETMDVINQWASDHTMGMIPEVLKEDSFNPDAVSYLLNALYFKGIWSSPFKKEETQDESFGGGDKVPMMHQFKEGLLYTENDLYQAVRLPYGNGAYRMDVFLPREDKTVGEVLETLSGSNWQPEYENTDVDLKLPRFETDTNQDLVGVMAGLGMPKAFSIDAEFPYFCNGDPYISQMFQVAKIKLDEEGTEAAAVTVIEMTESIPQRADFHANRPFLYIISEQSTGVIFFIGQYTGGVTADIRTGIVGMKAEPKTGANNLIYNLSGQQLSQEPARGLYIKNGKVMIK